MKYRANPRCWMRCAECSHRFMEHRSALGRASRLRCPACGSLAVDASKDARKDLRRGMDALRDSENRGRGPSP